MINQEINDFLKGFCYNVLHEQDIKDPDIEHFFVGIDKKDIYSKGLKEFLEFHAKNYPVKNLSKISMNFLNNDHDNYYLLIDSLSKKDGFFTHRAKFVENNAANILSIKWTGEPIDKGMHFIYNVEKYFTEAKDFSIYLGSVVKKKIKNKIK